LRKLLLEEADKAKQDPKVRIPVLVSLRRFKTSTSGLVRDAFQRHGARLGANQLDSLLSYSRFFLLFDGVNELPREETRLDLESFRLKYRSSTPMVFTTRDIGLGGDLGIHKKLEIAPLSAKQIESFVHAYIGDPHAAKRMLRSLRDRTRELAQTPLLLWMLCSVFKAKESIPLGLGEVFRIFTGRYELEEKKDAPVSKESRRWWPKLLAKLAYHMMKSGDQPTEMALVIARDEVEKVLNSYLREQEIEKPVQKAAQLLDDLINHHLLSEDAQAGIEFLHQLIQEYYAAEYMLTFLPGLGAAKVQHYYLNYLKWTEPIAMMMEFVDSEAKALELIRLALDVDPVLGARLAGRVKKQFQEKVVQLVACWQEHSVFQMWLLFGTASEAAVQPLMKASVDENEDVRKVVTYALVNTGSEEAIEPLKKMCWDKDEDVRTLAAYGLGKIGTDEAIQALMEALVNEDADVRRAAAFGLGWTDRKSAIQPLIRALEDKDEDVRSAAARALGRIGAEEALENLLEALAKDEELRVAAAYALGKIGTEAAVRTLIRALEDKNEDVRSAAAFGLGWTDSESAIQPLIRALEDKDEEVRSAVAEALGRISAEEAIEPLIKALADRDEDMRSAAARALGRIGAEEALLDLIGALEDKDEDVRSSVAEALGRIGAEEAIEPLIKALADRDEDVRSAAARALARIGSAEAVARILTEIENGVLPTSVLHGPEREFAFSSKELPSLSKLAREKDPQLLPIIFDVQQRFRYYNPALLLTDRRFLIIHLSDLHFGEVDRAEDLYVQLLLELKKDIGLSTFDTLVISGDVVNKSKQQGYNQAQAFLSNVAREFDLGPEKILMVPGNHDMNRQLSKGAYTVIRREDLTGPISEHLCIDKGGDYVEVGDTTKHRKRFADFQSFFKTATNVEYSEEYSEQITWSEYSDQQILIVGMNSAWQLDHHYKWRSGIDPDALNKILEKAAKAEYSDWLKIAVWHHPIKKRDALDTELNKSWIRDDGFMERLAVAGFNMVLHGHAHASGAWKYPADKGNKKYELHIVGAGTVDAEEQEVKPGKFWQYNIIKIAGTKVSVECRKRVNPRGVSWPDKDWLDVADKPVYEFDLLDKPV